MRVDNNITCDICKEVIVSADNSFVTIIHDPFSTDIYFNDTCPVCSNAVLAFINTIKK
jgi:hypothetical protein